MPTFKNRIDAVTNLIAVILVCLLAGYVLYTGGTVESAVVLAGGIAAIVLARHKAAVLVIAAFLLFAAGCNTPAAQQGQGATEVMQAQGVTANIRAESVQVNFYDRGGAWLTGVDARGNTYSDQGITLQPQATGDAAATAAPETSVPIDVDLDGLGLP